MKSFGEFTPRLLLCFFSMLPIEARHVRETFGRVRHLVPEGGLDVGQELGARSRVEQAAIRYHG
jgi:hypothetical protein